MHSERRCDSTWKQTSLLLAFTNGRTFPSAPWWLRRLTHALFITIPQAFLVAMAIHPLVLMDEFVNSTAEVVGSLVSTPYFWCTYNRFTQCLLGVETRWIKNDIGHRRRGIRRLARVDGSPWDWREQGISRRGLVSSAPIELAIRWWSHHYSVAAPWKHGAHHVKRGRTSPRGRGSHSALPNWEEGVLLELRRNLHSLPLDLFVRFTNIRTF
jgi:hypothetical protein